MFYKVKEPFIFTIFGASGDLAKLKLFPALYSLMEQRRMPEEFYIVGFARSKKNQDQFKKEFEKSITLKHGKKVNKDILTKLLKHVYYFSGQYDQQDDFWTYRSYLKELSGKNSLMHLAYFSVPPTVFPTIVKNLGESRHSSNEDLRLIIEKPFGNDCASATELFHFIARYFREEQIYLLDHYLGKTSVQSLLHLRHSNRILNLMMKGPVISNIQITASEEIGVGSRAGYFDQVGTLKDMFQSHLLQILSLITMSIPITNDYSSLHREKESILSALKFPQPAKKNIVLGQYEGYRDEQGVAKNSHTNTFFALRLFIDRESWFKVPIYIRSGKKLHEKHTYVVIEIEKFEFQPKNEEPNRLIFELQPDEKVNIRLVNPASGMPQDVMTSESIACTGEGCLPEHGGLLLDVIRENRLHFLSFPEVIANWKITDSILNSIARQKIPLEKYKEGTMGPKAHEKLTAMDGFTWFDIH
jgi:glucose-6-phosphate 1-dehydrogenase